MEISSDVTLRLYLGIWIDDEGKALPGVDE